MARLTLDVADRRKAGDGTPEPGARRRLYHRVDVLVGAARLFGEPRVRRRAHVDAVRQEAPFEVATRELLPRLRPAHRPSAAVSGAVEGGRPARDAGEEIRPGLHAAADDHRLAGLRIFRRETRHAGAEGARGALPMHQELA